MRNTHMARGRKKRQKEKAHRIDVNVEALTVPIFHVFPKEEHAIAGASLLGQIDHRPAQHSKQGNLLLVTLWNAALMIGILLYTGRWRVSREVLPQT